MTENTFLEHDIIVEVKAAQKDEGYCDRFIKRYMPFIRSETAKFLNRPVKDDRDDELSIAMFAFYEAIKAYDEKRGSFIGLAKMVIKSRLIDYTRKEERHEGLSSLDMPVGDETDTTLLDTLVEDRNEIEEKMEAHSVKAELAHFAKVLAQFDLTLSEVADQCPKQDRSLEACHQALAYAKANVKIIDKVEKTGKLPIAELARETGVSKKTLERHRKYMVAIILAYTNGFDAIRAHLSGIFPQEKGGVA